jgi:hypothetical protein
MKLNITAGKRPLLFFTLCFLFAMAVVAFNNRNWEFLYYTAIVSTLLLVVVFYHKTLYLTKTIMAGLLLVAVLHILGGNVNIGGTRLYDFWILGYWFRYDNLVHFIGSFVATFIAYNILQPHLDMALKRNWVLLSIILVLMASGIGAVNEILELGAVIMLGASQQVGGYMNNAFDLVWNFLGSAAAVFFLMKPKPE